jgi:hypothetical protein
VSQPYEIFATGACDVYLAVTGTADPVVNVAPPGAWIKVGVAGSSDYGEDGVRIRKETENNEIYALGLYGVRKVFRVREKLTISFTLMDATMEALRDAFNQTVVSTIVGPPAEKTIPLLENVATPTFRSLLVRAPLSPYMSGGNIQFWVPLVYQTGATEFLFKKSDPVGIEMEFTAIADATSGFGKAHAQTA